MKAMAPHGTLKVDGALQKAQSEVVRPLANFDPDIWGDLFLNYTPPHQATIRQMEDEVKELKDMVRNELLGFPKNPKQRLEYVDAILRLGLAYHFENEIQDNLQNFHINMFYDDCFMDDLHYVSLRFRLLRQHGYYVPTDVFNIFKSDDGSFKQCLASDVQGMLNLYDASYLRLQGECVLDEALAFTTTHLTSIVDQLNSPIVDEIRHTLKLPLHKRSIRLESRYQISYYESQPHDKTLLRLAKVDFNFLQVLHNEELRDFTRWSRGFDATTKMPNFMRERVVEIYFWSLGVFHEPKYATARMYVNKLFKIVSNIDDLYDSYGTLDELESFTEAIQRWEKSYANELQEYLKLFYLAILDTFKQIEQDLAMVDRSYAISYVKQHMLGICQAYLQEKKWCDENIVPTYEAYVKNGIFSSGYMYCFIAFYLGMEDASRAAFEWIHLDSKAPKASCVFTRLINDISSHKFERKRNHIASAVECDMKQFGTTEDEAYKKIQLHIEETWKDMNEDMLSQMSIPKCMITTVINFSRVLYDFYKIQEDGYTMNKYTLPKIRAVLIDPVTI